MRAVALVAGWSLAGASGCASPSAIPPAGTPFLVAKLAEARTAPPAVESAALSALPGALAVPTRASAPGSPVAGLVDLASPALAAFAAAARTSPDAAFAEPLDAERVLAAVWMRNPAVAAARADAEAARRAYEQASWLEDLEMRFRSIAAPGTNGREAMAGAPLAYPGAAALRGEMLDRAADMADARVRMVFLESSTDALRAFHDAAHHEEEAGIRRDQLGVLDRLVDAARARVESGRAPQAELSEAVAERAMVSSDLAHAETSLVTARRRLDSFLARDTEAPLTLRDDVVPDAAEPDAASLLALARSSSPGIAMARAEAAMLAASERMALRMTNPGAPPVVAAAGNGDPMDPMGGSAGAAMARAPEAAAIAPAWAAEIAARRAAADAAVAEALRRAERDVAAAIFDVSAMARMFRVARDATEPATRQSLEERLRLFEGGRGEFPSVLAAFRRHLDALHDVAQARHDHAVARAMLVMAVGARPGGGVR